MRVKREKGPGYSAAVQPQSKENCSLLIRVSKLLTLSFVGCCGFNVASGPRSVSLPLFSLQFLPLESHPEHTQPSLSPSSASHSLCSQISWNHRARAPPSPRLISLSHGPSSLFLTSSAKWSTVTGTHPQREEDSGRQGCTRCGNAQDGWRWIRKGPWRSRVRRRGKLTRWIRRRIGRRGSRRSRSACRT